MSESGRGKRWGGGCGKCCLSLEMLGMCWEWFEGYQGVSGRRSLDIARCSWEQQSLQDLEVVWGTLEPLLRGTEPLFHYSLFVCACVSGVHVLKCVCKGQKTLLVVHFLLPYGDEASDSGCHARRQVPLPTEPPHRPPGAIFWVRHAEPSRRRKTNKLVCE